MINKMDFFKGIPKDRVKEIIHNLSSEEPYGVRIEEENTVYENTVDIFRNTTLKEIDKFESVSDEHRIIMHWCAGLNIKDFLNIE